MSLVPRQCGNCSLRKEQPGLRARTGLPVQRVRLGLVALAGAWAPLDPLGLRARLEPQEQQVRRDLAGFQDPWAQLVQRDPLVRPEQTVLRERLDPLVLPVRMVLAGATEPLARQVRLEAQARGSISVVRGSRTRSTARMTWSRTVVKPMRL